MRAQPPIADAEGAGPLLAAGLPPGLAGVKRAADSLLFLVSMGFSCWAAIFRTVPGLRVCCFVVNVLRQEFAGSLKLVAAVPEHVGGHPHNPERNSNHKDH